MPAPNPKTRTYFILAPREMSEARVRELIRTLLQKAKGGRVIFGIAEEPYVLGYENQPQFRTLKPDYVNTLVKRASESHTSPLQVLTYSQKDGVKVIQNLDFTHAIVINGSFARSFHLRDEYQAIHAKGAKLKFLSPFLDEAEAQAYAKSYAESMPAGDETTDIQKLLNQEAIKGFDNAFQNAAILIKAGKILACVHNTIVPYATYAWHHGAERERHLCQSGDSSHYDTCHAETAALIQAGPAAKGADLYCRTFPCPQCARNLIHAGVKSVSYQLDFGDPYGYTLFKAAGISCKKMEE